MHKWAKEILECVKSKINGRGLNNLQKAELEEFKLWTEISCNIAKTDYYIHVTDAMENAEEDPRYYTQPRNAQGEYMRRGYMPEMYRDMDYPMGKMYYTEGRGYNASSNGMGYNSDSRYERARRGYEESKQMNPNMDNMQAMEKVFDVFEDDIKELKPKMTANEKAVARNKLSNIINMLM